MGKICFRFGPIGLSIVGARSGGGAEPLGRYDPGGHGVGQRFCKAQDRDGKSQGAFLELGSDATACFTFHGFSSFRICLPQLCATTLVPSKSKRKRTSLSPFSRMA